MPRVAPTILIAFKDPHGGALSAPIASESHNQQNHPNNHSSMARLKSGNQQCWIKNEEYEQLVNMAIEAYCEMPSSEKGRLLACAQKFGIPKSTLPACLNGRLSKPESAKLHQKLFPEEEQVLIQYLKDAAHWGFPDT